MHLPVFGLDLLQELHVKAAVHVDRTKLRRKCQCRPMQPHLDTAGMCTTTRVIVYVFDTVCSHLRCMDSGHDSSHFGMMKFITPDNLHGVN